MTRSVPTMIGSLLVIAGCAVVSVPQPTGANKDSPAKASNPNYMGVSITLHIASADRKVQFNGGSGALQNDINNLIVGLFDNGTIAAANASFGYVWSGAGPSAATITAAPSPAYMTDVQNNRLGTNGTATSNCACTITTDKTNPRRFLVRDYGTATTFVGGTTTVNFSNVPSANGGTHTYVIFAAAYDSAVNNLGYAEAALADTKTQGTTNQTTTALTLNLKQGVFTNNLSQAPTLTTFIPSATLRGWFPD